MNELKLWMRPGAEPVKWDEFRQTHPAHSIALDGYVKGSSQFDPSGPWLNLDHHADVDRLSCRATCAQVLLGLRQGLLSHESPFWRQPVHVFVNDCDEDVCLSWYLLNHAQQIGRGSDPNMERLVHAVDLLDTTAGACLYPLDEHLLREIAWIFEPYRFARFRGLLNSGSEGVYRSIVAAVCDRIATYASGSSGTTPLDLRYDVIETGNGWTMVKEIGAQARLAMVRDGVRSYVSVQARENGWWSYVIGRVSPFVPFDIPAITAALNRAEPRGHGTWGGGNLIAGSPRQRGSKLSPTEVADIVEQHKSQDSLRLPPFRRNQERLSLVRPR